MARSRVLTPLLGLLFFAALVVPGLTITGTSRADDRSQVSEPSYGPPQVFEEGTWSTQNDNAHNGCLSGPDAVGPDGVLGDMHTACMFNTDPRAPIEFNINVGALKASTYYLRISAWDVDSPAEVDEVWLNGQLLGSLTGAANTWSVSTFTVPANLVVAGNNCVEVQIDTANPGGAVWCTAVNYGSLFAAQPPGFVPGLGPYGLVAAALLLLSGGIWAVRRKRVYEA